MTSACMSTCIADDARVPVRATYVNLYKWPESDREFVRSVSRNSRGRETDSAETRTHPRVVDSISCRQLYLRSYTFSRKESFNEKTMKCIGRVKEKAAGGKPKKSPASSEGGGGSGGRRRSRRKKKKCTVVRKALCSIFRRLLSCTTKIDVVD